MPMDLRVALGDFLRIDSLSGVLWLNLRRTQGDIL
jgi:hypothetical protein